MERASRYRSVTAYVNSLIVRDLAGATDVADCRDCIHLQFFESLAKRIAEINPEKLVQANFDFGK